MLLELKYSLKSTSTNPPVADAAEQLEFNNFGEIGEMVEMDNLMEMTHPGAAPVLATGSVASISMDALEGRLEQVQHKRDFKEARKKHYNKFERVKEMKRRMLEEEEEEEEE